MAQPSKEMKEVDSPFNYCGNQDQREGSKTLVYMKKYEFNIILGIVTFSIKEQVKGLLYILENEIAV